MELKKTSDRTCDGQVVPAGWEGVHVFRMDDLTDPQLVASVELPCGSHTATAAGVSAGPLIVYSNNSSSTGCGSTSDLATQNALGDFMDVIAVPIGDPAASLVHREPLAGPMTAVRTGCHDVGAILGTVNKAACASADAINVFDIGTNQTPGGSPEDPQLLFTIFEAGVGQVGTNGRWHSAAFTWDGEVVAAGWEPGGGTQPECEATDPDVDRISPIRHNLSLTHGPIRRRSARSLLRAVRSSTKPEARGLRTTTTTLSRSRRSRRD